jgi:predicted nuclease of predicted toxin-antitoxin system
MKILLDESLPRKLRDSFGRDHEVFSVLDKGWLGKKNGELLKLMMEEKLELSVTVDQNLPYQQNVERLPLAIIILRALDNRIETLRLLIPKLLGRLRDRDLQNVIGIS